MNPLISILIRISRPALWVRCRESLYSCGYSLENIKIVTHNDDSASSGAIPFHYNLFCNGLKDRVKDDWFFYLDDDDILIPGALSKISEHLTDPDKPVICQMLRNGNPKPGDIYMDKKIVSKGRIGMPCLILHAKHKDLFTFPATEDADYQWIKTISEKLDCKFIKIPVVDAGSRSHGL